MRTEPATLTTTPSPKIEITASRWRVGSLRLQIRGIGIVVTRKSVKMLITLAEKTMSPSFMHLCGYVGATSQYALMGLGHKLVKCLDQDRYRKMNPRALEDTEESEHEDGKRDKDHGSDKSPVVDHKAALSSTKKPSTEPK